ncbi:unnamed protein product [Leuciscus chuanchicus]
MAIAKQGNNVSCNHNHVPPWDRYKPAVASLSFDVQNPPSLQRRLAVGAEEEADGPRQDAANLTSLFPFQPARLSGNAHKTNMRMREAGELLKEIWAKGKPAAGSIKAISHLSGHLPPVRGPIIPVFKHLHLFNEVVHFSTSDVVGGKVKDPPSLADFSTVSQQAGTDTRK